MATPTNNQNISDAQAKAGSDKEQAKKDKEVRLMNVTNRTFNRVKYREIVKVKKSEAEYYIANGFNYFDEVAAPKKEELTTDTTSSAPVSTADADDADNILNNL